MWSDQVRRIALGLPDVSERRSHGVPCLFVAGQRPVCYFHDHHHGDDRLTLRCPAPPGVQDELVRTEPERFSKPPPSASGTFTDWLGVVVEATGASAVDWDEIAAILEDAFRAVAPKQLIAPTRTYRRSRTRSRVLTAEVHLGEGRTSSLWGSSPGSPPRRRFPGLRDVDGFRRDFVSAEFQDADVGLPGATVVANRILRDPHVAGASQIP
jgi:hypothetical protein